MRPLLIILFFIISLIGRTQENPILGHWAISYNESEVTLDWTIVSGNTCQGIYIWRSTDGYDFEEIGHIPGLCGSISEPIDYVWQDPGPAELTTNYYRIELGGQGLSTVKSLFVDKLIQTGALVYPNPATENATLIFKPSSSGSIDIQIYNSLGYIVRSEQAGPNDRIRIDASGLGAGTYLYNIIGSEGTTTGRFIIL